MKSNETKLTLQKVVSQTSKPVTDIYGWTGFEMTLQLSPYPSPVKMTLASEQRFIGKQANLTLLEDGMTVKSYRTF